MDGPRPLPDSLTFMVSCGVQPAMANRHVRRAPAVVNHSAQGDSHGQPSCAESVPKAQIGQPRGTIRTLQRRGPTLVPGQGYRHRRGNSIQLPWCPYLALDVDQRVEVHPRSHAVSHQAHLQAQGRFTSPLRA
jgi:hypothetical protein